MFADALVRVAHLKRHAARPKNTAGFYFPHPYNARLAAIVGNLFAALVHRFLTYLSRVCKSRLSKKLIKKFWVFRLATMFYAPVNRLPVLTCSFNYLRLP